MAHKLLNFANCVNLKMDWLVYRVCVSTIQLKLISYSKSNSNLRTDAFIALSGFAPRPTMYSRSFFWKILKVLIDKPTMQFNESHQWFWVIQFLLFYLL